MTEVPERHAVEDLERHRNDDALRPRAVRQNVVLSKPPTKRRLPAPGIAFQVLTRHQAVVLHVERDDRVGDRSPIEVVAHSKKAVFTRAAAANARGLHVGEGLEGPCEVGHAEAVPDDDRAPPLTLREDLRVVGEEQAKPEALEEAKVEIARHRLVHREPLDRDGDGRRRELGESARPVLTEKLDDDVRRRGHELGHDVVLRHDLVTASTKLLDRGAGGRGPNADVALRLRLLRIPDEERCDAWKARSLAIGDVQHQEPRDGSVERVAAAGQHLLHRVRGPRRARDRHVARGTKRGSRLPRWVVEGHRISGTAG